MFSERIAEKNVNKSIGKGNAPGCATRDYINRFRIDGVNTRVMCTTVD